MISTKRIIVGIALVLAGASMGMEAAHAQPMLEEGLTANIGYSTEIHRAVDSRTGVYKAKYVSGGKSTTEWCYLVNGEVQYNYTGFASNSNGWWYVEKGKVTFKKNDVIKGKVKGQDGWWLVKESKVQFVDSVEKNSLGWWRIKNGKVDFNYTGFAKNSNGWWYCENGKVNFKKKDVIKGTVNGESGWWFVKDGKVQFINSVEKNSLGWWRIKNGKADFNFTGFAKNDYGWWYCKNGKVDFGKRDVLKGTVDGETAWWYVKGGMVQFVDSVEKNSSGWWAIYNGKVDFSFEGMAENSSGWWYCKNGMVDFSYNGTINTFKCFVYTVKNGKAVSWYEDFAAEKELYLEADEYITEANYYYELAKKYINGTTGSRRYQAIIYSRKWLREAKDGFYKAYEKTRYVERFKDLNDSLYTAYYYMPTTAEDNWDSLRSFSEDDLKVLEALYTCFGECAEITDFFLDTIQPGD